ncbi:conserved hypothetical protein [Deferribacter desulfuricans SSM1]|uniref:Nucleoside phosphorylase domain-containing protein n=1 Tax=Deferribacter desulfuricans (strain DSM 14783 / JCM 11476 / NBRC 101012 / SSM1) TaxID=639282 RepID=D3PDM4_DEFDS|nr:hypothetical protein [Deferribacter desulfuricans]BAI80697.1 conserved hypothetical protein [Deferribacter desulfuricans SSM1]
MFNNMIIKNIIVIPTIKEYEKLFDYELINYKNIFSYAMNNDLLVVVTGIGKVNIAIAMTYLLSQNIFFENLILAGIAGAYRESGLNIGDVVTVRNDFFVDEALFLGKSIKMSNEIEFPVCLENKTTFLINEHLKVVDANTISLISGDDNLSKLYHEKTGASIESMEGASFGLVCEKFSVTSYQIRGISNFCGKREKQKWDPGKALKNLKNTLYSLFIIN